MVEVRGYHSKRQLVSVDEFLEKAEDSYVMCINGAMLYAFRTFAKSRLRWDTTFWKTRSEQTYTLPDANEKDQIDDIVSAWIADSEVIEMCNQALLNALNDLSSTIRLSSCCFEGGPGGQEIDGDFYYGTETPLEDLTEFGEGQEFETEAEWLLSKCAVANGIVNGMIGTLNGLSILSFLSLNAAAIVAGMVGIGLIFVPPVALMVAIIATGLVFGTLSLMADEIDENREALVCALYNSTSATDAYDNFKSNIEDFAIDIGVLEIQVGPLADLIMNIAPIDTMNSLFRAVSLPEIAGDLVGCDTECAPCPEMHVYWGTHYPGTGNFASEYDSGSGEHWASWKFNYEDGVGYCDDPVTLLTLTEITGGPNSACPTCGYRIYNQAGTIIYEHADTPPASPLANVGWVNLKNNTTAFTVNFTI